VDGKSRVEQYGCATRARLSSHNCACHGQACRRDVQIRAIATERARGDFPDGRIVI
jgi:hypothetical protein